MTHMTKEEKARAYDYALEILHKYDGAHIMFTQDLKEEMFPELKESEDERLIKAAVWYLEHATERCAANYNGITPKQIITYLEKQKVKERFDRMAPIYNNKESFESALEKAWKYYNECDSRTVESLEGDSIECVFSKGFREGYLYKAIQKEQKPEHFELKEGRWYICHHAYCCRADSLTVKEGERFMCEKDGVVKGFVIKEPEKYFIECSAPAPMEDEQKEQKPENDKAFEEWLDDWYQGSKEAGGDVVMSEAEFKNWSREIKNMYQQKPTDFGSKQEMKTNEPMIGDWVWKRNW